MGQTLRDSNVARDIGIFDAESHHSRDRFNGLSQNNPAEWDY
jgi:hypothetical protein